VIFMRRRFAVLLVLAGMLVLPLASSAAPAGVPKSADLFAGQTQDVGDVFVWNDLTNYFIEINMDDAWCMTESHVAIASTVLGIPQNSQGNPTPGLFPYGGTYSPCADGDTFTIPIGTLGPTPYIAVHVKAWEEVVSTVTITSNAGDQIRYADTYAGLGSAVAVDAVVPTFAGTGTWPAVPGATYISNQAAGDPFNVNRWRSVTETLTVPGLPLGGQLWVNSDNYEFTKLNGLEIQRDDNGPTATVENSAGEPAVSPQTWSTVENVVFTPLSGANLFQFVFRNSTWAGGGSFIDNPTGLSYKAQATYYAHSESAWAGSAVGVTQFNPSKSWATFFQFTFAPILIQTLTVPAANPAGPAGVDSAVLANGESFLFKVAGTVTWTNRNGADLVDAECTSESGAPWAAGAVGYPDELLELQVNSLDRDWTPVGVFNGAGCANAHEYTLAFTGAGAVANFRIYDGTGNVQDPAWFGDNAGSLTVQIWQTAP
jgi:hypothetical protein